jgi:hypothetical protein
MKQSRYLLVTLIIIASHTVVCMQNPNEDHSEQEQSGKEEKNKNATADFKERMAQAKEDKYIRDNSIQYRMASTMGDHATRGFMEFCAKAASDAVLEVVKRELDIRYDDKPTIGRQLEEIASGITIIHNAVNLSDDLARKETVLVQHLTANNQLEKKKRETEINNDADATLRGLRHLRNEHIDQLNAIRQKRNPNFKPYSAH